MRSFEESFPEPKFVKDTLLMDLVALLWERRVFIGVVVLAMTGIAGIALLLVPPLYTAETMLLPPQQSSSVSAMSLGAMGSLAASSGLASQLGLKNPADMYVGILKSRSIADAVIKKNRLVEVYQVKKWTDARSKLAKRTRIEATKESLIHVSVDDNDPKRSAEIANSYTEELYKINNDLALTEASQRRAFFEKQFEQEKNALAEAEVNLRKTQETTGMISPSAQAEALIRSQAQLQAEIASKEVQLKAMSSYAAEANPELEVVRKEIAGLEEQLHRLEAQAAQSKGNMFMSGTQLPKNSTEYIRSLRNAKYHEMLYEMLARSFETSRLDESKASPVLQVVDKAVPPDTKSWPPRALLLILSSFVAILLASLYCIAAEFVRRLLHNPVFLRRVPAESYESSPV
jgi:tyrosine-protein kinase Etk/Wzc